MNVAHSGTTPALSMVYTAYNAAKTLRRSVESALNQNTRFDYEIIIVDNNSGDETPAIIRELVAANPGRIRSATESRQGASFARGTGFALARADIVSIIDDDNFLDDGFVRTAVEYFKLPGHETCGILAANLTAVFEGECPEWFPHYQAFFACGEQGESDGVMVKPYVYGAGMTIRRELLNEVLAQPLFLSGRNETVYISGEDTEISMRAMLKGYQLHYCSELRLEHYMRQERMNRAYLVKLLCGNSMALPVVLGYYLKIKKIPLPLNDFSLGLFLLLFAAKIPMGFLRNILCRKSVGWENWYQFVGYYRGWKHFRGRYRALERHLKSY